MLLESTSPRLEKLTFLEGTLTKSLFNSLYLFPIFLPNIIPTESEAKI